MSPSNHLTREELLEMAELDAIGALDEYEQTLFHRGVINAPTAVQEEVRNVQASICADDTLLPNVEPGESLKLQVLSAIACAIDEENEQLAPLATIGAGARNAFAVRGVGSGTQAPLHLWRAAAFAMAAGLLVCLFFLGKVVETNKHLAMVKAAEASNHSHGNLIGEDPAEVVRRSHVAFVLVPGDGAVPGQSMAGVVAIAPVASAPGSEARFAQATVMLYGLPAGLDSEIRARVVVDGETYEGAPFLKLSGQAYAMANVGVALPADADYTKARVEILAADGSILLTTTLTATV